VWKHPGQQSWTDCCRIKVQFYLYREQQTNLWRDLRDKSYVFVYFYLVIQLIFVVYKSAVNYTPTSLGCYTDSSVIRTLTGSSSDDSKMTPTSCSSSCRASGYKYAGLEYGRQVSLTLHYRESAHHQCYCGNTLDETRKTTSGCTVKCAGDSTSLCGGAYRLNVYQVADAPGTVPSSTSVKPSSTSVKPSSTSVKPSTTSVKPSTTSAKPSTSAVPSSTTAPVASASVVGVKTPPTNSNTKYVWAHHMVGNVSLLTFVSSNADQ
jgi:glucan endo-1,3-alpha-glucosidase